MFLQGLVICFRADHLRKTHAGQHSGRLCLHIEIGVHFLRCIEANDFAECRAHCTKNYRQVPAIRNEFRGSLLEPDEIKDLACNSTPLSLRNGQAERTGFTTYLSGLGRPVRGDPRPGSSRRYSSAGSNEISWPSSVNFSTRTSSFVLLFSPLNGAWL